MSDWGSLIDRMIREAQERGQFDNLPGKGQPLDLDDDALTDPEWRLANRVLKNAGFAPDWIEMDREVRDSLEAARTSLTRSRQWRFEKLGVLGERRDLAAQRERDLVAAEWQRAVRAFVERIQAINRQIATLNLKAPSLRLQRNKIDVAQELQRLEQANRE
jgi:hypothetical protein